MRMEYLCCIYNLYDNISIHHCLSIHILLKASTKLLPLILLVQVYWPYAGNFSIRDSLNFAESILFTSHRKL